MTKSTIKWAVATIAIFAIVIEGICIGYLQNKSKPSPIESDSWSCIEVVGDNDQMVPCVRQNVHVGDSKQIVTACDRNGVANTHNNYGK